MTRLDHNRGQYQLANKIGAAVQDVDSFIIWGNHSPTMFPDTRYTNVNGQDVNSGFDQEWYNNSFMPVVQQRGAAIIAARKLSSAASAANAAIEHIRDWHLGSNGQWVSMGVPSNGSYGVEQDLQFSFPCVCENGEYKIVEGLELNQFQKDKIDITLKELIGEKTAVANLLSLIHI